MKKVAFYTLGCKLNFSETSSIVRMFEQHGFQKVEFDGSPDIVVINTCSVTENADKKCRQVVKGARKVSENPYIIIIGCYAQLKPKEISEITCLRIQYIYDTLPKMVEEGDIEKTSRGKYQFINPDTI